ncbi:MAG: hypothetical protein AB8B94_07650 [Hyphomicrobiales bacterium]
MGHTALGRYGLETNFGLADKANLFRAMLSASLAMHTGAVSVTRTV